MPSFSRAQRRCLIGFVILWLAGVSGAAAAPEGTLTIGMHFTPVPRWLDPAEGESTITPYLLLYHLGFPIGVGPRVDDIMASAIPGFYMSPYEDLKLRRP